MTLKDLYSRYAAFVQRFLPFGNAPPIVGILIIFVVLWLLPFILGDCSKAHGAELEFSAGSAVIRGPASAIGAKAIVPGVITEHGDAACGFMLIGASDYKGEPQRTQALVHCQIISHIDRFNFGLGAGVLQHDDAYNGGKFNFSLMLEVRTWEQLYVTYQHFSNSASAEPNLGRDLVLLAWRFQ